jgi:Putative binding domain, N-terminal
LAHHRVTASDVAVPTPANRVLKARFPGARCVGISIDAQGDVVFSDGNRIRELVSPQLGVGCQYSIDQAQQAFTPTGGSASVGVLASAATCPWLAVSYANWVTVSGGAVGSGTGLVTYSAAPNPNSASRTGTLWIAGSFLAVTQSGLTCSLNVPTRNVSVAAAGVTGATMTVSSNAPDCSWSATANVPWILLGSPSNGSGNGTLAYTVGVNTGGLRTGAIAVAGRTVYINQVGAGGSTTSLASIANGGVVNAASYAPPISPGSFVGIYGQSKAHQRMRICLS